MAGSNRNATRARWVLYSQVKDVPHASIISGLNIIRNRIFSRPISGPLCPEIEMREHVACEASSHSGHPGLVRTKDVCRCL
jgi:hypothetical protein